MQVEDYKELKILIIGMGEIGKAVQTVLSDYYKRIITKDVDNLDINEEIDVLHICYGFSPKFIEITKGYIAKYKPSLTIVHTTTEVGTVEQLGVRVAHAPIRGKHEILGVGIKMYPLFVGYSDCIVASFVERYFSNIKINVRTYPGFRITEILKILSLLQFGWNIEFARYAKDYCEKFNVNYENFRNYTDTYNDTIINVEGKAARNKLKYNLEPPIGPIGGHCVKPAMEISQRQFPSPILKEMLLKNKTVK